MAKLCIYCGQPLPKDDAHQICTNCGRAQSPPSASAIKVKLPPKEFPLAEGVPAAWQAQGMFEVEPGPEVPNLSQREQQAPSRLPKRPVRRSTTESQANVEPPLFEAAPSAFVNNPPKGEVTLPLQADEPSSTMVLPGWQEELAFLRQELSASSTIVPRKPLPPSRQSEPLSSSLSLPNVPFPEAEVTLIQKPEQEAFPLFSASKTAAPDWPASTSFEESGPRELHVKVWEQEQEQEEEQPGLHEDEKSEVPTPIPSVEPPPHSPFGTGDLDLDEQISEKETMRWQAVSVPPAISPSIEEKHERVRQKVEGGERTEELLYEEDEDGEGRDVEDLPTVPVAVPEVIKRATPQITIERTSTPAPRSLASNISLEDDVENLPTMPMAASTLQSVPRSPIPPVAPGSKRDRSTPVQWPAPPGANTPSGPYGSSATPSPALPTNAVQGSVSSLQSDHEIGGNPQLFPGNPSYPGGPAGQPYNANTRAGSNAGANVAPGNPFNANSRAGSMINPQALSENPVRPEAPASNPFNPPAMPSLPYNPASQPGNLQPPDGPEFYGPPAHEMPASATIKQPPNTPQTEFSAVPAALAQPHKRRRPGRILAIVIVMLLLIGASSWYVINYQPFTNPLAHPYQAYQSTSFGFALDYPEEWVVTSDQAKGIIHFADTSQTGQIDLSITPSSGQTLEQYLTTVVAQEGMTKPSMLPQTSFAGATWEQRNGTVTQNGATYTIVLYVTQHNDRYYALASLAPSSVYDRMEHDTFAHLRNSFLFL